MADFDTEICICFHVPLRKLWYFARREQPRVWQQMSDCLGAGTGCGSCRGVLESIFEHAARDEREKLLESVDELLEARNLTRRQRRPT